MTTSLTTKQAAAKIRGHLNNATGGWRFRLPDGEEYTLRVPAGLKFNVRATRDGVNVSIEDRGYIDDVTGGDRHSIDRQGHLRPIVELVEEYEQRIWGRKLGKVEWADILISAEVVGPIRRVSS
jgi:hypothetical protein